MLAEDLQIYKDTYSLVLKLLTIYKFVPRLYKFSLGDKICNTSLNLFIHIERANKTMDKTLRAKHLGEFLNLFDCLKTYIRLLHDVNALSDKDFSEICILTTSIGKQANGWKKS